METEEVQKHYAHLPTHKLSRLAQKPEALPTIFILVLQRELLARGEEAEALGLSTYLTETRKRGEKLTEKVLREKIKILVAAGYSLHETLMRLAKSNVDIFYSVSINSKLNEFLFNRMRSMKEKGAREVDIEETFQDDYGITSEELQQIVQRFRNRGTLNLLGGYGLILIAIALGMLTWILGEGPMVWHAILLPVALWRIYEGHRILKDV